MGNQRFLGAAGTLMIVAGLFNLLYGTLALTNIIDMKSAVRYVWVISPLPWYGFALGLTGHTVLANVLMLAYLLGILFSITGGIVFIFQRSAAPRFVGTVGALLCFPVIGVASIVLTIVSHPKPAG